MSNYPEHRKLKLVADKSQILGEFLLEWLPRQGIHLAEYHTHGDTCYEPHVHDYGCAQMSPPCTQTKPHTHLSADGNLCMPSCKRERDNRCGGLEQTLYPAIVPVRKLLAAFFEIDEDKLETEKRQMLDECRAANAEAVTFRLKKSTR